MQHTVVVKVSLPDAILCAWLHLNCTSTTVMYVVIGHEAKLYAGAPQTVYMVLWL